MARAEAGASEETGSRTALWGAMWVLLSLGFALVFAVVGFVLGGRSLETGLVLRGDPLIVPNFEIGFVRPASATTVVENSAEGIAYTIFTDSRGLRSNAPGRDAPLRADILTVGGSFSAGHGFENERTYTEELGRRFGVPVANSAVSSYGTVSSQRALVRFADLAPKVVIYGLIGDHLRRNLDPCAPSFHPPCLSVPHVVAAEDGTLEVAGPDSHASDAAFRFSERLRAQRELPRFHSRIALGLDALHFRIERRFFNHAAQADSALRERALLFVLRKMRRRAERLGARLVVLSLPILDAPTAGRRGEKLRAALPESVVVVDFAAYVREFMSENRLPPLILSAHDHHPNEYAHGLIARALAEAIEREGLL